jgi:hypothetical protein
MNIKLLLCIAMGVFVAHLAVFMMLFTIKSRQLPDPPMPPPPNFKFAEQIVRNPENGTRIVNREITVSTKLRGELYKGPIEEAPAPTKK